MRVAGRVGERSFRGRRGIGGLDFRRRSQGVSGGDDVSRHPGRRRLVIVATRFLASGLQLVLVLLLTRTSSLSVVATSLVMISSIQILSAIASWGHAVVVLREVSAADERGMRHAMKPHVIRVGFYSAVIVAAGFLVQLPLMSQTETVVICICAGAQALTRLWSQALKSVRRETLGLLIEFALVPAASCVAVAALALSNSDLKTITFASIQLTATLVALLIGAAAWLLHQRRPVSRRPEALTGVHSLGVVFLLAVATAHLPIVVAPALLTPLDVAAFAVAFRVAALATTILNALTGYYAPRYSRMLARQDSDGLRGLLRESQWTGAVMALPLVLLVPVSPWVFSAFGAEYDVAAAPFAALVVGQFFNAATGVVAYVVSLSGSERALLILRLCTACVLPAGWGIMILIDSANPVVFAAVYSAFLVVTNASSLMLAHRLIAAAVVQQGGGPHDGP
jgi:O-antigen/teichoic acid export membrane protein